MEEDNDDQWLYGDDPSNEKPVTTEDASDRVTDVADVFSEKENEAFANPSVPTDDNLADLEPPIIKPLDASNFDNEALPPGEEDILVPLDPPIINPPGVSEDEVEEQKDDQNLVNGEAGETEEGQSKPDKKLSEGEEEDDDDDNINVVIGDIRTTPNNYNANLHIKRGNLLTLTKVYHYRPYYYQQQQYQTGKFAVDDFETVGVINGVPAHEFNLDNLEDKPWRKPGADITDYFNYGFNEDTWRAYCERQKRIRVHESGSGLIPMNQQPNNVSIIPNVSIPPPNMMVPPVGMPPPDHNPGSINVIGGANTRRSTDNFSKENTIQVMTADRREYSKKNFTPDLSVPPPIVPPPYGALPPGMPPPFPPMNQYGPPPGEYFAPEMDPYYHSYEPHQDPNWGGQNWNSSIDVKNMISLSNGGDRAVNGTTDTKPPGSEGAPGVKVKTEPEDGEISRDRDRSRDYDRDRESRHRDRSHRHRSRSRSHERRSRKHKSRSRSPGYRSHKKKKSKKSERSKSESD